MMKLMLCIGQDAKDTNYMHDAQNLFYKGKQIMNKKPIYHYIVYYFI